MKHKILYLYPLILAFYSVFSFTQTSPNLVLSSNPIYWSFQQYMWQIGYHNRELSSVIFLLFILAFFGLYIFILDQIRKKQMSLKKILVIFLLCVGALLPSYPSLSNDIYNYLMNAKMMHVYKASPYEYAAWDFPDDPWPKFMTNVHTTTPYGKVWTGIGYAVYGLTWGDLQFGMLGFRLLAIIAVALIGWSIWILSSKKLLPIALFCLNPLVLLEAVSNTHNDITMMAFFMVGLALFTIYHKKNKLLSLLYLSIFWLISVYTKLVTIISPIVYLGYLPIKKLGWDKINYYDLLSWALIIGMCADGSKRFFTWYLLWSIPISVLAKSVYTKVLLIFISFGGLLSYLPYLYTGEYNSYLENMRIAIYFILGILFSGFYGVKLLIKKGSCEK